MIIYIIGVFVAFILIANRLTKMDLNQGNVVAYLGALLSWVYVLIYAITSVAYKNKK